MRFSMDVRSWCPLGRHVHSSLPAVVVHRVLTSLCSHKVQQATLAAFVSSYID